MSRHAYEWRGLRGDYIRAAIGLGASVGALVVAGGTGFTLYLFGAFALLFGLFGARTAIRQQTIFELTDESIRRSNAKIFGPSAIRLMWRDVTAVKLSFYSTRRDRSNGWMQLKLAGVGGRLSLDSTISGFENIAERAARAAADNGVRLGPATVSNFAAAGISVRTEDGRAIDVSKTGW